MSFVSCQMNLLAAVVSELAVNISPRRPWCLFLNNHTQALLNEPFIMIVEEKVPWIRLSNLNVNEVSDQWLTWKWAPMKDGAEGVFNNATKQGFSSPGVCLSLCLSSLKEKLVSSSWDGVRVLGCLRGLRIDHHREKRQLLDRECSFCGCLMGFRISLETHFC